MSLRRRNTIAWALLVLAAVCWAWGQRMLHPGESFTGVTETTSYTAAATTQETAAGWTGSTDGTTEISASDTTLAQADGLYVQAPQEPFVSSKNSTAAGFVLSFAGLLAAAAAVFFFRQRSAAFGPDCAALLLAAAVWIGQASPLEGSAEYVLFSFLCALCLFAAARELWGWICAGFSLSWCAPYRLSGRCGTRQGSLLLLAGWVAACAAGMTVLLGGYQFRLAAANVSCAALAFCGLMGAFCLWRFGADLQHFQEQLNHFQKGQPVTVGNGAFSNAEEQLLQIHSQHEQAVQTAVTSERFKVELISNVSHDLRTPLTAIVGYGELLRKETLSPDGREQLQRLNQKAGYMRDLVESLFELTKVSSGVLESKAEEIDLIRLLEQTIGLFDDQLSAAGLVVRRHYASDSVPVVTDGARMHQVFANLLGNAIKYALPGTRIHLEVKEDGSDYLIRLTNTASYEMDFAPEEIMQRFARGDKARSTPGSGLGLAIAQTYTQSVGGDFHVAIDGDQFSAVVTLPKK